MHIAFVTYAKIPHLTEDDQWIERSLEKRGIKCSSFPWDTENVPWETFDAVVLRSCWDYYLKYEEFLQWLEMLKIRNVNVFNGIDLILHNSNKEYLKELSGKGVVIPATSWIDPRSPLDICSLMKQNNWKKAVMKPCVSAGAYETYLIEENTCKEYEEKLRNVKRNSSVMVQEYLEEINSEGEISLIFFGNQYSHAVLKIPATDDFRVQLKFGGTVQNYEPSMQTIKTAENIIASLSCPELLYARVDGVLVKERFVLMELELIEPCLFFSYDDKSSERFADALEAYLK